MLAIIPFGKTTDWYLRPCTRLCQEIIKERKWIPHIGPLTKVIPLKLFLDIVPSSSEDITRAMRGQPKRLTRNYPRKNVGNVILYVLASFHTGDVLCSLSRLFVQSGISFVFLLAWLFIIFCRLFGFRQLNQANFNGNGNGCDGCVSVRYNFLFISLCCLQKFTKQQR